MATYYHGAQEVQTDNLQTLYLMNPNYVGYADAAPANMVLLNSMNSMNPMSFSHSGGAQASQNHLVGIPLQPVLPPQESATDMSAIHGLVPRLHYNIWGAPPPSNTSADMASPQFNPHRPSPAPQQGLSLSLSSREMVSPVAEITPANTEAAQQSFLMGSKFLKAAQQLLDEVVNVGKGAAKAEAAAAALKTSAKNNEDSETQEEAAAAAKRAAELSTAERQELQMKKAKLANMLDEVEQRYRQYHHQMQIVVSAFEAVAGTGSARTYTALALQTISKQFRCLRDAIAGQIQATSKSLGEEETKTVGSRLRYVDHHLRQQRALQQLGMIQHNAWRPQRGLPERSVSILRAWLFEHFLHPYPKDSDKHMLAKQTGLTRSQVSNWFINARVRLWKPMVEEMYLEETKEKEQNADDENAGESKELEAMSSSHQQENDIAKAGQSEKAKQENDLKNKKFMMSAQQDEYYDEDEEAGMQPKLKKARSDESLRPNAMSEEMSNRELLMKFMEGSGRVEDQGYSLMGGSTSNGNGNGGGGGGGSFPVAYSIGEMERFGTEQFTPTFSSNGVSLTLGLQHCDSISLSAAQPSFLSNENMAMGRRIEMGSEGNDYCNLNINNNGSNPSNAYEMDMQSRKRFAAQLMRDFVA